MKKKVLISFAFIIFSFSTGVYALESDMEFLRFAFSPHDFLEKMVVSDLRPMYEPDERTIRLGIEYRKKELKITEKKYLVLGDR